MTPPVALASFAAGTIAGEDPMKIAFTAMRVGVVAFIVPFAFAYDSVFLLQGNLMSIIGVIVVSIAATYLLSIGFAGYFNSDLTLLNRGLLLTAGLLCFFPTWEFRIAGLVAGIIIMGLITFKDKALKKSLSTSVLELDPEA